MLFRSEEMQLVQLFVPFDAVHDTIEELGNIGVVQFVDLNPTVTAFNRHFVNEVKRCDEMERKLRFLVEELRKEDEAQQRAGTPAAVGGEGLLRSTLTMTLDQLEARLDQEEAELSAANSSAQLLERNRNELVELKHVLEKDQIFFQEAGRGGARDGDDDDFGLPGSRAVNRLEDAPLLAGADLGGGGDDESFFPKAVANLGFITGVVEADKFLFFERVLWRATRGNLYLRHAEIDEEIKDTSTGNWIKKYVFIIFYQGNRIEQKVRKICEAFKANLYPCPDSDNERRTLLTEVNNRLLEVEVVMRRGASVRQAILQRVGSEAPSWTEKLRREKAIYNTMNMMNYDHGRKCLIANGWVPVKEMSTVQEALDRGGSRTGSSVPTVIDVIPTDNVPPTYFRTNRFTEVFQDMVDAYGVARYGEVNPAVFAIATFPFLFAVMYGDVGHGILMVLAVLPIIIFDKACKRVADSNEIFGMAYDGRYLLLMMSLGAIYTGFLYNEFFAIPMNIFGSSWSHDHCGLPYPHGGTGLGNVTGAVCKELRTYPFGIDPMFRGASNELIYSNSLKMKMSIIIGVLHMTLGIFMHLLNAIKFRRWYNVLCEFIPQMLFLWCLFGYLVIMVIYKWSQDYGYYDMPVSVTCGNVTSDRSPPQLIGVMISLALPFFNPITCDQELGMFGSWMGKLQTALLLVAFVCIPWMLVLKPLLLLFDHKRGKVDKEHGDHFSFGEVFVHQMIHAIEFVLGTVSNTASYLRLWALSLAHAELSLVFYEKALVGVGFSASIAGGPKGILLMFATWGLWGGATMGVLVVMEALSAFLHALRLHWVEFQNKFYQGDGVKFAPFDFVKLAREQQKAQSQKGGA